MRFDLRHSWLTVVFTCVILASVPAVAAPKLKGFYAGSGGATPEVHRVVLVEFATDGTAIVQQKWHEREEQVWHTHWTQDGKKVKIVFDPTKDGTTPTPLLLDFKNGTLTPTDWDATALGILGPPKLTPFGGKNQLPGTATPCVSINAHDPSQNCVTWDSRR